MRYQSGPYINVVRQWASTQQDKVCGNSLFTRLIWTRVSWGGQLKTQGHQRKMRAPAVLEANKYLSRGNMLFSGISGL